MIKLTNEWLYALSDAMGSVTAITDAIGSVKQRFSCNTFGEATLLTANFTATTENTYKWNVLFHGEYCDLDTNWSNYGYRYCSTILGKWIARDPIEEEGGLNLYGFVGNNGVNYVDVLGLKSFILSVGDFFEGAAGSLPLVGTLVDAMETELGLIEGQSRKDYITAFQNTSSVEACMKMVNKLGAGYKFKYSLQKGVGATALGAGGTVAALAGSTIVGPAVIIESYVVSPAMIGYVHSVIDKARRAALAECCKKKKKRK